MLDREVILDYLNTCLLQQGDQFINLMIHPFPMEEPTLVMTSLSEGRTVTSTLGVINGLCYQQGWDPIKAIVVNKEGQNIILGFQ